LLRKLDHLRSTESARLGRSRQLQRFEYEGLRLVVRDGDPAVQAQQLGVRGGIHGCEGRAVARCGAPAVCVVALQQSNGFALENADDERPAGQRARAREADPRVGLELRDDCARIEVSDRSAPRRTGRRGDVGGARRSAPSTEIVANRGPVGWSSASNASPRSAPAAAPAAQARAKSALKRARRCCCVARRSRSRA
jgi:hypothetical protein